MKNFLVLGEWNAQCDRCGLKKKASSLRLEWTGLRVCEDTCWEVRHPQTLIRVPQEDVATPWARPEGQDTFITVSYPLYTEAAVDESDFSQVIKTETGAFIYQEGE